MSEYIDPDDESLHDLPATGKVYEFNGQKLEPFSVCRDDLYNRLTFEDLSEREAAGLFIFICLQTKERCVMVRGQEKEAAFRVEESEWRESIGWMQKPEMRAEAMRIRKEILGDIYKISEVGPKPPENTSSGPTPPEPGNESRRRKSSRS